MSNAASYSRVSLYNKCPSSFEWQYVLGHKEEFKPGPAALRGLHIHEQIEKAYLAQDASLLPKELKGKVKNYILRGLQETNEALPEMEFCFDDQWQPLEDFNSDQGFVRGYIDNVLVGQDEVLVHEYKTGKVYDDHGDQRALYGLIIMLLYPHITNVTVVGLYIDEDIITPSTYNRTQLMPMKMHWQKAISRLHIPVYPARPGIQCRWCPKSSKHKEGPCAVG